MALLDLDEALSTLWLVDHHCHGLVRHDLDDGEFESLLTEAETPAPGTTAFDSLVGLSVRRWCAPVLGLPPHATAREYLTARRKLGCAEAGRRLLAESRTSVMLVDTGYRPRELLDPAELAELSGARTYVIARLETIVEQLADEGTAADEFARAVADAVAAASKHSVGLKSIAAYRTGLDLPTRPPSAFEVTRAAAAWLRLRAETRCRLTDRTLILSALWAGVDSGLPIQFHTGFGDADENLHRANPVLLTEFCRAVSSPVVLLHCYPYQREAAWMAHVLPNVYFDVGLAATYAGDRARTLLAEALELAPFAKLLYSSDAFGLAELYFLGALRFRQACSAVLGGLVTAGEATQADAVRIAETLGSDNARSLYGLADRVSASHHGVRIS
jgi:predicted TIM-barrel fold metal-dependent hydrolase